MVGHRAPQWFYLLNKHFNAFQERYPALLNEREEALLVQIFDLGSNPNVYSHADKLEMIQSGLPVVLNAGFKKHHVNVLIWKDRLILCNRGGGTRHPIQVFHFDPSKFTPAILKEIERVKAHGTVEDYKHLFHTVLPEELGLFQTGVDLTLQNALPLPVQTVGNCSFVSLITAVFAFLLLGKTLGIDQEGKLGPTFDENKIQEAITTYQLWLADEQITTLEENILLIKEGRSAYKADHPLIIDALRKAHLLPLDAKTEERLDLITDAYLSLFHEESREALASDLIYRKTMARAPLL